MILHGKVIIKINLNNATNDRIIVTKDQHCKRPFTIVKLYKYNNLTMMEGKNFAKNDINNGVVKEYFQKLIGNIPEEQITWDTNEENESIELILKKFDLIP